MDRMMVAQGEGFIRRYIELDVEEKKPGAEQALEWMNVLSNGLTEYRRRVQELENKLTQAKIVIG